MRNIQKVIWGVVLLLVGVIILLNTFGITDIDVLFPGWWTLFIIIPCGVGLITDRDKTGNAIGLGIGVILLLSQLDILDFSMVWKLIVPVVIIAIALKMIIRGMGKNEAEKIIEEAKTDNGEIPSGFAAFSGHNMNFDGQVFDGAELNAVFGGVKCDLRGAIIEKDCAIKISAIFGGVDILLPEGVNVKIESTSVFGGVSDKTKRKSDAGVTVYISGLCLFGGADIK